MKVFTVDFTQKPPKRELQRRKDAGFRRVVDMRLFRSGRLARVSKWNDLYSFLRALCDIGHRRRAGLRGTE